MAESPDRDEMTPDLELIGPIKRDYPVVAKTVVDGPTPTAAEGKSEEIYEVQQILEHLLSPDGLYLKVRWTGYGEDQDSWEPEVDLKECAGEIVREYLKSLPDKEKKNISKLRRELAAYERKSKTPPKPKAAKKKETKPRVKREVESDTEMTTAPKYGESSDSDSDMSTKRKNKGRRRSKAADDSFEPKQKRTRKEQKSTVTTKAALKQYPSSAKQAAIKHRQTWLNDSDSSDNERDEMNENSTSFDDEIKAKLQTKKRERVDRKNESRVRQQQHDDDDGSGSESPDPEDSDLLQTPPKLLFKNVDNKPNGPGAMVLEIVKEIGDQERNGVDSDWNVEGITQHKDNEAKTIIVLLSNSKNGEKKTVSAIDAYELAGWNLCKWLFNRCTF